MDGEDKILWFPWCLWCFYIFISSNILLRFKSCFLGVFENGFHSVDAILANRILPSWLAAKISTQRVQCFPHGRCTSPSSPTAVILSSSRMKSLSWQFLVPFSGWKNVTRTQSLLVASKSGIKRSRWQQSLPGILWWLLFWLEFGTSFGGLFPKIQDKQVPCYYKHPDITGCFIPFIHPNNQPRIAGS